jgi:hypothetical protein
MSPQISTGVPLFQVIRARCEQDSRRTAPKPAQAVEAWRNSSAACFVPKIGNAQRRAVYLVKGLQAAAHLRLGCSQEGRGIEIKGLEHRAPRIADLVVLAVLNQ